MPTPYENLNTYLRPGHPKEQASDSSIGNTYLYRAPTATIAANKPAIGDEWADGRRVALSECYEISGASGISDLMIVTAVNYGVTGVIGTTLQEVIYELDWRPLLKP